MITLEYGEVVDLLCRLDEVAKQITTLEDIQIGEALDNIYNIKASLHTHMQGFEDMLDAMADEYD